MIFIIDIDPSYDNVVDISLGCPNCGELQADKEV